MSKKVEFTRRSSPPKLQPIDSLMQSDAIAFGVGIDLRLEFELEFWNSQKILL
jgi:hypothetical protein